MAEIVKNYSTNCYNFQPNKTLNLSNQKGTIVNNSPYFAYSSLFTS